MSIHELLVSEANYQTNQHNAGARVVQCITLLNRAAAHVAALESTIAILRAECKAYRKKKFALANESETSYEAAQEAHRAAMTDTDKAKALEDGI